MFNANFDSGRLTRAVQESLSLLTAQDVAALLNVKVEWIYDRVEAGEFPVVRLGRQLRFRPTDVAAYLNDRYTPMKIFGLPGTAGDKPPGSIARRFD